ncbi:hypothetical protein Z517_12479 [Fonsecaea pedrosoi CBS 271.37]|uniref:Uncharacterized protein n=1 Tax=Fonsecaea pedrosoi CBS 271.37 TaxID=1442368 RepID=A0A0D2GNV8_9EURO|nr:uncharacterized protein Z517_12479 [Fonsecaea pedrosoi CBS 271.37]KIW74069.1 hypothetical protein Z517_12479 [Fonsecaea pedrosoi CBS 271.37]
MTEVDDDVEEVDDELDAVPVMMVNVDNEDDDDDDNDVDVPLPPVEETVASPEFVIAIVVLEMTMIDKLVVRVEELDSDVEVYGWLEAAAELVVGVNLGVKVDVVETITVVPLMTVTVVPTDVDVLPLLSIGPWDREEVPLVLLGVRREDLEVIVVELSAVVVDVVVDLNTPVDAMNDVLVVLLIVLLVRQEAGIVKQHGRPLDDEVLGWNTPL